MPADPSKELEHYYDAWRRQVTTDDQQVERAVRRLVSRQHRLRARRHRKSPLLATAVVLIAALAYAANRGGHEFGFALDSGPRNSTVRFDATEPKPPETPSRKAHTPQAPALGSKRDTPSVAPETDAPGAPRPQLQEPAPVVRSSARNLASGWQRSTATSVPMATNGTHTSSDAPKGASEPTDKRAQTTPKPPESRADTQKVPANHLWREVGDALREQDPARARGALRRLATSSDTETRAKALVGLAQMELGRKNCARAKSLSLRVTRMPNVSDALVNRALLIAARCTR